MKKQLLFLVSIMLPLVASADDIAVQNDDGVYIFYNYTNNIGTELEVTYPGDTYGLYPDVYTGSVVIPEEVTYRDKTYKVTSIARYAFYDRKGLTSVTIPSSITSIGETAFGRCTGLTSVTINSNSVVSRTYSYNSNLRTIFGSQVKSYKIGDSVTSIGQNAFYGCTSLTDVTIPSSVTSIGNGAFYGCAGLTDVTIPSSVTSIGQNAFYGCTSLTDVTIPSSVTSIGNGAFYGCAGLTSVHISDLAAWCKIEFGDNSLFYAHHLYLNGEEIKDLVIPSSVTSIGDYAFFNCTGLTSVTIPNSMTKIGKYAFQGCTSLQRCSFGSIEGLLNIKFGNAAANPLSITKALNVDSKVVTELVIPESVTSINDYALYNCNSIKKMTGGKNVTSIGKYAFYNNSKLTSIQIGGDVETIGDYAFNGCPMTSIYNYAEYPQNCASNVFSVVKENCKLYVQPESVDLYKVHQDWYEFNILAMDDEALPVESIRQLDHSQLDEYYDLSGHKLQKLQRGMNILRMKDGTTKKVMVK